MSYPTKMPNNFRNPNPLFRNGVDNPVIVFQDNILPVDIDETDINLGYEMGTFMYYRFYFSFSWSQLSILLAKEIAI